jgi:hypothetical protein
MRRFDARATRTTWLAFATLTCGIGLPIGCGGGHAAGPTDAGLPGDAGPGGLPWPPVIDPAAIGHADLPNVTVAAFSQVATNGSDPQVLALVPDLVPRAWAQWDTLGTQAGDYGFSYAQACQAAGIAFIGGLTASVIFQEQMSAADFADEVGRDATDQPVPHAEIVPLAFRGALASPGFRQRLIDIAELQIDGGVDGIFFDEVVSSYIGLKYDGDEGFDDHDVADFGRFLCAKHAGDPAALVGFDLAPADGFDCAAADPGAGFDYRGYLARHGAATAPLGAANPLAGEWGTVVQNRPDPSKGTFVQTFPALVYWQQIVLAVRQYARQMYGKEILITGNGILPFVDFQSVGVFDYNPDGPAPFGFNYVPTTGTAPDVHFDGTVSYLPVLASLKAQSKQLVESAGGTEVPVLVFLDWPTDSINRYYALPTAERQDYIRIFLAEANASSVWLSLPLATTTDTDTATALGMMDFFGTMRGFYRGHADLFRGAHDSTASAAVSVGGLPAAGIASHLVTLDDGRTVLHLVNHNYAAGFISQSAVTAAIPVAAAPTSVTLASPDLTGDQTATFSYAGGNLTVNVGTLVSSIAIVVQ